MRAEDRLPRREIDVMIQVRAAHAKVRMRGVTYTQIQIARGTAIQAGPAFPGDANPAALVRCAKVLLTKGAVARLEELLK